jgi:hypothetical protein
MKEFVESIPKIIGLFSVSALALSISHEFGYYQVVGAEFRQLLSTSDYIANIAIWAPETVAYLFVVSILNLLINKDDWNALVTYPDIKPKKTIPERIQNFFWWSLVFSAVIATIFGAPAIFLQTFVFVIILMASAWIWTVSYLIRNIVFFQSLPRAILAVLLFGPALVISSYLSGVHEAYEIFFSGVRGTHLISLVGEDSQQPVFFLRSLDKGILLRDPASSRTKFVRWDQITKISAASGGPRTQSLFCQVTGLLCGQGTSP